MLRNANTSDATQQKPTFTGGRKFHRALIGATALFAILLMLGCAGCESPGKIPRQLQTSESGTLAPGDVLRFSFPSNPELNQSQKIQADGKVSLPLIGVVSAGGKRLGRFQDEVQELYKSQIKNNAVAVSLDSSSVPVYVTGAVARPGKVILERPLTVLEAIMEAGGTTNIGTLKGVVLIRNSNGQHYTQSFDLSPTLKGQKANAFFVKPYDIVYVPERFF